LPLGRQGRLAVRPTLQVAGYPEIFVAGDLAEAARTGAPLPMTAPVATQQGAWAAHNLRRLLAGRLPEPFRFRDRGAMATIGRNGAVAWLFGRSFTGFAAWLIWLAVHLFNLIGLRNRLLVLLAWAWDYVFTERVVRLILPGGARQPDEQAVTAG
jgi:NADH dehydrogenase